MNGTTVTLGWTGAAYTRSYIVEAGSSPGATNIVVSDTGSTATGLVATGVGGGTYYVRMPGRNECGISGPSNETIVLIR